MGASDAARKRSRRLSERLADRDNNFDVIRLAAAATVLISHSYFLAGHAEPVVPTTDEPWGNVGVLIFFALSGFLVTGSWLNEPRAFPFMVKRALRILPGLFVVVLLTAYLLGPLLTTDSKADYLTSGAPVEYVLDTTLMLDKQSAHGRSLGPGPTVLPGVFEDNPDHFVNGSLWSLPVEVTLYLLLLLTALAILFRGRLHWRLGLLAVVVAGAALALRAAGEEAYPLFAAFAGGALLYLLRGRLRLRLAWFAAAVALWVVSYRLPLAAQVPIVAVAAPYAVVFLAFRGLDGLRRLTYPGDLSYGVYIYAWPVAQLVVQTTDTRTPAVVIALGGAITYALAFVSWRAVERPALRLKGRIAKPIVRRTAVGADRDVAAQGSAS